MLGRFSLYGFLKNQRYHEPFFVLALVEQGLSFLDVGLLIAARELVVNLLEIPSGALADLFGRRRCMVLSFAAYIGALVLFGLAPGLALLYVAMVLYAIGDAFRSGTHKAMIFAWLKAEGREDDKAEVYGYTRSWSKRGTAVAALVGAGIALGAGDFTTVFWSTLIPYALNLANLASYPSTLEGGAATAKRSVGGAMRSAARGLAEALRGRGLRRLVGESMVFHGSHKLTREYLQPLVEASILALPFAALTIDAAPSTGDEASFRGTVVALGLVYFALGLIESAASRRAGRFSTWRGGPDAATRWLWWVNLAGYAAMLIAFALGWSVIAMVVFVVQTGVLHNLFRPVQLARFDEHTPEALQATVLSAESQSKALFVVVLAPFAGWLIDHGHAAGSADVALWPLAALGAGGALVVALARSKTSAPGPDSAEGRSVDA